MELEDLITEIKERLNIVEIVSRYVELRPVGNRFVAPCPFHQETKPSFNVNPEKGFFYCFGCQAAGDVISFYQRINGLEFKEALKDLAREAGINFKLQSGKKSFKKTFFELYRLASDFFRKQLDSVEGKKALEYLRLRKVSKEVQALFALGYSLQDWHGLENYFKQKKIDIDLAVKSGLLVKNNKGQVYDRFRDRLMFPIRDLQGRVIAFGGRVLGEGEPKYLNSNDSLIYKKGEHLYGLYEAKPHLLKQREVFLVEGYLDVLALVEAGFANCCAILGTSLTESQAFKLSQLVSKVIVLLDGDDAGKKAALRSTEILLAQGLECEVVLLPLGEDPDSFLKKYGAEEFKKILTRKQKGLAYCLKMLRETKSPREQIAWAGSFLEKIKDLNLKGYYVTALAEGLKISEAELRAGLKRQAREEKETDLKQGFSSFDADILRVGILFPKEAQELEEEGVLDFFKAEEAKKFWQKLISHQDINSFTDKEKEFFVQVKWQEQWFLAQKESILSGIRKRMLTFDKSLRRKNLYLALTKAQQRQDWKETKRLLELIQKEQKELAS